MICFDVELNGKRLCRAGVGESGVLSSIVSWVGGSPRAPDRGGRTKAGIVRLSVGGLLGSDPESVQMLPEWVERLMRPGDTVSVTVVEASAADPYRSKHVISAASIRQRQRRYFLQLKREFEPKAKPKRPGRGRRRAKASPNPRFQRPALARRR
jgi:hypothetical protein